MKPQQPARGISLNNEFRDSASFTVTCDCHSPDHSVNMWIAVHPDAELEDVSITFYVNTTTPWYKQGFSRIRTAWNVLVHGYHEQEAELMLNSQSATNLAQTIINYVECFEKHKVDK